MIESLEALSEIYDRLGQLDKSLEYDNRALMLKLDSRTEWPDRLEQKRHIARSHYNIGSAYYKKHDHQRALEHIAESYKTRDMLYLKENHPELFITLNALANVYEKLGDRLKCEHFGRMADHMRADLEIGNRVRKLDLKNFDVDEDRKRPPPPPLLPLSTPPSPSPLPLFTLDTRTTTRRSPSPPRVQVTVGLERSRTFGDKLQAYDR